MQLQKYKRDSLESSLTPDASQDWTRYLGDLSAWNKIWSWISEFHCSIETCALFREFSYRKRPSVWGLVFNLASFLQAFVSVVVTEPEKTL